MSSKGHSIFCLMVKGEVVSLYAKSASGIRIDRILSIVDIVLWHLAQSVKFYHLFVFDKHAIRAAHLKYSPKTNHMIVILRYNTFLLL